MNKENIVAIRVWGDFACFTRPEMKVERVSYPLPTPSAARGILEAIYWEPQMYYLIESIYVIKKGRWFNFRRNEVSKVVSINETLKWIKGTKEIGYIEAGGGAADAVQRNMLALADVEYIITAEVKTTKLYNSKGNDKGKYFREIKDRARKGKCHYRPALGCREFAAEFDLVEPDVIKDVLAKRSLDIRGNLNWESAWQEEDLGLMLYDVFDEGEREDGFRWLSEDELANIRKQREAKIAGLPKKEQKNVLKEPIIEYEGTAIMPIASFFHAKIKDSVMDCHPERVKIVKAQMMEDN
jgi:CRISPR-associated protein Cas5d